MTDDPQLAPGPTMDAELAGLMGVEPEIAWVIIAPETLPLPDIAGKVVDRCNSEEDARCARQAWREQEGGDINDWRIERELAYPPYSTTDAGMGVVLDWFNQRKTWGIELRNYCGGWLCSLSDISTGEPRCYTVVAPTRAEAVGRAALKTRERG